MGTLALESVRGPYLHLAIGTESWAYGIALEERAPGRLSMYLRGPKMRTVHAMFEQFAAAYQFPYDFAKSWPAFEECLGDLSWLPDLAPSSLTVIGDAGEFLADEAQRLPVAVEVFENVANRWGAPNAAHPQRPPCPFHVVFHERPGHAHQLRGRLARAGAQLGATWRQPRREFLVERLDESRFNFLFDRFIHRDDDFPE